MNEHLVRHLREELAGKPRDELDAIYAEHDLVKWPPEAFEAIKQLFAEGGLWLPAVVQPSSVPTDGKTPPPARAVDDDFSDSSAKEWFLLAKFERKRGPFARQDLAYELASFESLVGLRIRKGKGDWIAWVNVGQLYPELPVEALEQEAKRLSDEGRVTTRGAPIARANRLYQKPRGKTTSRRSRTSSFPMEGLIQAAFGGFAASGLGVAGLMYVLFSGDTDWASEGGLGRYIGMIYMIGGMVLANSAGRYTRAFYGRAITAPVIKAMAVTLFLELSLWATFTPARTFIRSEFYSLPPITGDELSVLLFFGVLCMVGWSPIMEEG